MRDDYDKLRTEGRNPRSIDIDKMSTIDMLKVINDEDRGVAMAVRFAAVRSSGSSISSR